MGIQINGSTDRITAIDGTIDFVSNIGNIGLITASNYVLQDAITIGAGSTIIKTVNGKLGIGSAIPSVKLDVEGGTKSTQYQLKKSGDSTSIGAFLQLTNQAGDSNSNDVTLTAAHSTNSIVLRAASKVTAWTYYNSAYRERVRINNDGRVWINSTTGASATELLRVENDASTSDDCRISIISGDAGESVVLFGDTQSYNQGQIVYSHVDHSMRFHANAGNERLRISSGGRVGINTSSPARIIHAFEPTENNLLFLESGDTNTDIIQADTGGSTRIRNSQGSLVFYVNGDAKSSSAANAVTGLTIDGDKDVHVYDDLFIPDKIIHEGDTDTSIRFPSADTISAETGGSERLRIHSNGITVWGNDNYFYGGGGGTNLNGDLKIRSTGTAVYQSLKFMSSDGTSQSQILGYGGGAILFHYANTFVWAINNQGERLELTNTALSPRANSTVLDLGTSSKRFRNVYTSDLDLSNEKREGGNDVDGTWGAYTIQEGESDLFLINRRSGKKYKFNLIEVD